MPLCCTEAFLFAIIFMKNAINKFLNLIVNYIILTFKPLLMNSKFTQIVRILLGLILIVFGINKIYAFIPLPHPPQAAADFMNSLADTGYILTVIAIFEIIIGIMLIFRIWVPFVLLLLVPFSVNILLFHLFMDIPAIGTALLVVVLNGILLYKHRQKYRPLFIS